MSKSLDKVRRYELKYVISEETAKAIRDYIQPIFSLDKNVPQGETQYTVNNLYFDTPSYKFYYDVKFRRLTRFKLRARYYGSSPGKDLWLEIKNKKGSIIWKKRRRIALDTWPGVLDEPLALGGSSPEEGIRESFEELYRLSQARPVLHVRYDREPWVSDIDDYGRITFDTRLRSRLAGGSYEVSAPESEMIYYDDPVTLGEVDSLVLLEIKVEQMVPWWAVQIIRLFELKQRGFSKYCYALDQSMEERMPIPRQSIFR
jgi:hypothetical protein